MTLVRMPQPTAKTTLPVRESEEERNERLKALEEALKAEEEGKEL